MYHVKGESSVTMLHNINLYDGEPRISKTSYSDHTRPAGYLLQLRIAGVKVNFRWAPAGKFIMGSPWIEKGRSADESQHKVELTQGFWLAETPTTQELWRAVMRDNPSKFRGSSQLPVDNISWYDCREFVSALNGFFLSRLLSAYTFAMPTEAQWEYACRAGTVTPFNFGTRLNGVKANCNGNHPYGTYIKGSYKQETTPVMSYAPNAWGLYDMHGNVSEWTSDWFDEDYYTSNLAMKDPTGPVSGSVRVLRGGSWSGNAMTCRSACRSSDRPGDRYSDYGFRLALVVDTSLQVDQTEESTTEQTSTTVQKYPDGDAPESIRKAGALITLSLADVKLNFHWAPAGKFTMGSSWSEEGRNEDERQHRVELTQGFWVAETQTTQELWQAVMGNNPSSFQCSSQLPVEKVSWEDCQKFVNKLNSSYSGTLPQGYKYAMPTEAQWEYACRAGTSTPFSFGSALNGDKANCNGNHPYGTYIKGSYKKATMPVKSYAPNAWGLYDMHGNVLEWCTDWYDSSYYSSVTATKDPTGPESGCEHVLRGGSWYYSANYCRSAYRYKHSGRYYTYYQNFGFRLVLVRDSNGLSIRKRTLFVPKYLYSEQPESTREAGAIKTLNIAGVQVNFRWAPAGKFKMGSPMRERWRNDDEELHVVELSHGFWIAETVTTQELWKSVMGSNPSYFKGSNQLPVEEVSWYDCQAFVNKLNSNYRSMLLSGYKYSLPTEAQWEYACRAGTSTPYNIDEIWKVNFCGDATEPVKSYQANAWGLFAMHGNVWEWCSDWYSRFYYGSAMRTRLLEFWRVGYGINSSTAKDPTGPISGSFRVLRGGSWYNDDDECRSASRGYWAPGGLGNNCGCRIVLVQDFNHRPKSEVLQRY